MQTFSRSFYCFLRTFEVNLVALQNSAAGVFLNMGWRMRNQKTPIRRLPLSESVFFGTRKKREKPAYEEGHIYYSARQKFAHPNYASSALRVYNLWKSTSTASAKNAVRVRVSNVRKVKRRSFHKRPAFESFLLDFSFDHGVGEFP